MNLSNKFSSQINRLIIDADTLNGKDSTELDYVVPDDYEPIDVLNKIKIVDGDSSGLDTDLIRGLPGDFSSDLDENGYQVFPSGLIIQWHKGQGNDGQTHTLPLTFPNNHFHTFCIAWHNGNSANYSASYAYDKTLSDFKCGSYTNASSTIDVTFLSIGN